MGKKQRTVLILISVAVVGALFLITVLRIPLLTALSTPCDSYGHEWGNFRAECDCLGVNVETTFCADCTDVGVTTGCVGYVRERRCYDRIAGEDTPVSCPS